MGRNDDFDRRTVLRGVGGVLAAGVLAGCSGGGSGDGSGDGGSGGTDASGAGATDGGSGDSTDTAATSTTESASPTGGGASAQVESWLGDANYDGSIADMTGTNTVEIAVGAGDDGFAFDPAAVRVSPGTTIRWTWTGRGGAHNVVAQDDAFNSGQPQVGSDITYEATLDQSGTYLYYCVPHRRLGMKGAVVVGDA